MLRIATFGRFEISRDTGPPLPLARGKPAALLAYLLLKARPVPRETVAELLWPGVESEPGRLNLRQALFVLRRQLGAAQAQGLLLATATHLGIDRSCAHQLDWQRLHAHAAEVGSGALPDDAALRGWEEAAAQVQGSFLEGFEFKASAEFDHWLHEQRSSAQQTLRRLLGRIADARAQRGELDAALRAAERAVELEPTDEVMQARLMQLQLRSGRADDALAQFERAGEALARELGVGPGEALRELAAQAGRALRDAHIEAESDVTLQRLRLVALAAQLPPPAADAEPEAAFGRRRGLLAELQRIVAEHGGYWVQAHGGEFLAYFGYPRPIERSAEHAVRAALALRARKPRLALGLHRKLVVAAERGGVPDELGELTPHAVALSRQAEPGAIVLSDSVAECIGALWHTSPIDGAALPCHRLEQPRLQRAVARAPLLGRDAELEQLQALWRDATNGRGHAVLLRGDAGIGKTRLIDAFVGSAGAPPSTSVRFAFDGSPGVLPLLQALAGVQRGDSDAQRERAIASCLGPEPSALSRRLSALLLRGPVAAMPASGISPLAQRGDLVELALQMLQRRCRNGPLLLVVDDVHLADAPAQALLHALLAGVASLPLLVLLAARAPWPADAAALRVVDLAPLSGADIGRMLAALGVDARDAERHAWLVERSAGVPLFAEELAALRGPAQASARIADLLGTRLEQLGDACATAQHAAVLGLRFDVEWLHSVSPCTRADLDRHLARLHAAGVVQATADGTLAFRHALLRDTAYALLGATERRVLHRRAALTLHATGGHAAACAEHWLLAQDARRAATAWLAAGADALNRHVYAEAAQAYARGLDAALTLSPGAVRDAIEFKLRLGAARAGQRSGNFHDPAAMQHLERALELAGARGAEPAELFEALWGAWEVSACQVSFHYGLSLAGKLLEVGRELPPDPYATLARYALGVSRYWTGNFERALADLQDVIAADAQSAEPMRNPYGLSLSVGAHAYAALCCQRLGRVPTVAWHGRRALVAAHSADDDYAWSFACTLAAIRERMAQRPARARAYASAGIERAQRSRLVTFEAVLRSHAAWADALEHRDADALLALERGVRLVELDYPAAMVVQLIPWVEALHLLDRRAEALTAMRELLQWRERLFDQRDDDSVERLRRSVRVVPARPKRRP
jgi:DNA-binding SARP family transcriptional activator